MIGGPTTVGTGADSRNVSRGFLLPYDFARTYINFIEIDGLRSRSSKSEPTKGGHEQDGTHSARLRFLEAIVEILQGRVKLLCLSAGSR